MDNEKIGKFISKLRKEKQMTQKDLAAKLNITDKAVSKWERGLSCPDISLLSTIADVLEVSINEILNGEKSDSVSEDMEISVDKALGYAEKTVKSRLKNLRGIFAVSYSVLLLLGIAVCGICDMAITGTFTWSLYPISSIIFTWLVSFPIIQSGVKGIFPSMVIVSVLILPFLYVIDKLIGNDFSIMPVGVRVAVISVIFLWSIFGVFKILNKRKWLAAAVSFLIAIPICFAINFSLAKIINEPVMDVWDILTFILQAAVSLVFFLLNRREKKLMDE